MRTVVVHDRLIGPGGSERVALAIAKAFNADIFTAKYDSDRSYPEFRKFKIREVNPVPDPPISQASLLLRMLDAIKFSNMKELGSYDMLFTSGGWAHFASVQNPHNMWYCHTPNRALYDLREEVRARLGVSWRPLFDIWAKFWTPMDQKSVKHVHKIVVNSQNVKKRVEKFYNRAAEVVNPPVDIKKFRYKPPENYWLSVQRIEPEKRIEIQLKVFEKFPEEKLAIVGSTRVGKEYLNKIARWIKRMPNVEWKKDATDKELAQLYSRCKGVIQTPIDEDFGLTAVEAMASGKPCIAVDEGGFRETIIQGKTGLCVKKPYVKNFKKIVKNFDRYEFNPRACIQRAKRFSEEEFVKKIKKIAWETEGGGTKRKYYKHFTR